MSVSVVPVLKMVHKMSRIPHSEWLKLRVSFLEDHFSEFCRLQREQLTLDCSTHATTMLPLHPKWWFRKVFCHVQQYGPEVRPSTESHGIPHSVDQAPIHNKVHVVSLLARTENNFSTSQIDFHKHVRT